MSEDKKRILFFKNRLATDILLIMTKAGERLLLVIRPVEAVYGGPDGHIDATDRSNASGETRKMWGIQADAEVMISLDDGDVTQWSGEPSELSGCTDLYAVDFAYRVTVSYLKFPGLSGPTVIVKPTPASKAEPRRSFRIRNCLPFAIAMAYGLDKGNVYLHFQDATASPDFREPSVAVKSLLKMQTQRAGAADLPNWGVTELPISSEGETPFTKGCLIIEGGWLTIEVPEEALLDWHGCAQLASLVKGSSNFNDREVTINLRPVVDSELGDFLDPLTLDAILEEAVPPSE